MDFLYEHYPSICKQFSNLKISSALIFIYELFQLIYTLYLFQTVCNSTTILQHYLLILILQHLLHLLSLSYFIFRINEYQTKIRNIYYWKNYINFKQSILSQICQNNKKLIIFNLIFFYLFQGYALYIAFNEYLELSFIHLFLQLSLGVIMLIILIVVIPIGFCFGLLIMYQLINCIEAVFKALIMIIFPNDQNLQNQYLQLIKPQHQGFFIFIPLLKIWKFITKQSKQLYQFISHKNDICSICSDKIDYHTFVYLPCNHKHSFHYTCIIQWLEKQNTCPLCRKHINLCEVKNS